MTPKKKPEESKRNYSGEELTREAANSFQTFSTQTLLVARVAFKEAKKGIRSNHKKTEWEVK
jgi:hypothetical protein